MTVNSPKSNVIGTPIKGTAAINPVLPGSRFGKSIGFTSELFDGYLWVNEDEIYVSLVTSLKPGEGNFRRLLETLLATGKTIKVPTPPDKMRSILKRYRFVETVERDLVFGLTPVMVSPAKEMSHEA